MKLGYDNDSDEGFPDIHDSDMEDADQPFDFEAFSKNISNANNKIVDEAEQESQEQWIINKKKNQKPQQGKNKYKLSDDEIPFDDLKDSLADEEEDKVEPLDLQKKRTIPNSLQTSNVFIKATNNMQMKDGKTMILPQCKIDYKSSEVLKNQHRFVTEGTEIYFPFPPYQCQKDFMSKVVLALKNGHNALLESPTGTGKTLSLLCASLAWLKQEREKAGISAQPGIDAPRIIYTSRTHSQLAQVQKELANTAYNPRSVVIGSRDHFCIHPQISLLKGFLLSTACKKSQKGIDPCVYGKNREFAKQNLSWEPLDIEELHEVGKRLMVCPYFGNKDRISGADIIFMPYNYLIDEKIRENFDVTYANSCIIFDEAHNVAQCAEDVTSFELKSKLLDNIVIELQKLQDEMKLDSDKVWDSSEDDVDYIISMARQFQDFLESMNLNQSTVQGFQIHSDYLKKDSLVLPGSSIFEIFFNGMKSNIKISKRKIVHYLERETQQSKKADIDNEWFSKWDPAFQRVLSDIGTLSSYNTKPALEEWYAIIRRVMRIRKGSQHWKKGNGKDDSMVIEAPQPHNPEAINDFYVYIYDEDDQSNQLHFNNKKFRKGNLSQFQHLLGGVQYSNQQRVLGFWCFNAGIGFKEIQALKPKSIILTSGTLAPLHSFQAELALQFAQRIENPHVISPEQVSINILSKGVKNSLFNFSFQNRDNEQALSDLGFTIAQISQVTPGGMLIFFPSYRVMERCNEMFEQSGAKKAIEQHKKVFVEPKDPQKYQVTMDRFYKSIFNKSGKATGNGAILMGVCRGRISEGLDFSDAAARCVIVVGIPYPQMTDPKVILKKDYLDKKSRVPNKEYQVLSGRDWYGQQATRAVNQAIGRVIRHVQDYGSIILIDERYGWGSMRGQISKWLRDRIKVHSQPTEMIQGLEKFFIDMKSRQFKPKVEQLGQVQIEIDDELNPRNSKGKINDTSQSEEEDLKQEKMMANIFKQNTVKQSNFNGNSGPRDSDKNNKQTGNTITKFFGKEPLEKKRTMNEVSGSSNNQGNDATRKYEKLPQKVRPQIGLSSEGSGLGFAQQEEDEKEPQNQIIQKPQVSLSDGPFNKASSMLENYKFKSKNPQDQPQSINSSTTLDQTIKERQEKKSELNKGGSSGIYSSAQDHQSTQVNKEQIQTVITDIKQFLTSKNDLKQLLELLREVKTSDKIEHISKSLKELLFGKIVNVKQDRQYRDKLECLRKLGQLMPKKYQSEYMNYINSL